MTMLKPLALILCTLVVVTHCEIIQLNNANLIEQTCKQTPNYALCIQYLKSDPRSSGADVTGLALIMVNVIRVKANSAINKINQLIRGNPRPGLKEALSSCFDRYRAIVEADVAQAIAGLEKGDPKFAEDGANDAAVEATTCENSFSGKSPLTAENIAMHDVAAITAAIVRLLL